MAAELCRHVLARNGRMWAKFLMDCSFSAKLSRKGKSEMHTVYLFNNWNFKTILISNKCQVET